MHGGYLNFKSFFIFSNRGRACLFLFCGAMVCPHLQLQDTDNLVFSSRIILRLVLLLCPTRLLPTSPPFQLYLMFIHYPPDLLTWFLKCAQDFSGLQPSPLLFPVRLCFSFCPLSKVQLLLMILYHLDKAPPDVERYPLHYSLSQRPSL